MRGSTESSACAGPQAVGMCESSYACSRGGILENDGAQISSAFSSTTVTVSPFIWTPRPPPCEEAAYVNKACDENRHFAPLFFSRNNFTCHLGVCSYGDNWHVAESPGHVRRHASVGYVRNSSDFGRDQTLGYGLVRPIRLTCASVPNNNRGIHRPTLHGSSCRLHLAACVAHDVECSQPYLRDVNIPLRAPAGHLTPLSHCVSSASRLIGPAACRHTTRNCR